jgi:hypothetical protein
MCRSIASLQLTLWLLAAPAAIAAERDPATGLVVAPGWELVGAYCGSCHSYQLVTAQRGDAGFWERTIRWMQRTQNLTELPAAHQRAIVDYLAANYSESLADESVPGRRPPVAYNLLPESAL